MAEHQEDVSMKGGFTRQFISSQQDEKNYIFLRFTLSTWIQSLTGQASPYELSGYRSQFYAV